MPSLMELKKCRAACSGPEVTTRLGIDPVEGTLHNLPDRPYIGHISHFPQSPICQYGYSIHNLRSARAILIIDFPLAEATFQPVCQFSLLRPIWKRAKDLFP